MTKIPIKIPLRLGFVIFLKFLHKTSNSYWFINSKTELTLMSKRAPKSGNAFNAFAEFKTKGIQTQTLEDAVPFNF